MDFDHSLVHGEVIKFDNSTTLYIHVPVLMLFLKAFHAHTRGMQHTTLVMEEKRKKGDERFKEERVAPEVLSK